MKRAVVAKFLEILALCGQFMTIRNPQLGYVYPWFVVLYCFANAFRMWGWLNYLIHGSRKHLQRSLVGFSTIGLQKSIVSTASNFVSTRSVAPPEIRLCIIHLTKALICKRHPNLNNTSLIVLP